MDYPIKYKGWKIYQSFYGGYFAVYERKNQEHQIAYIKSVKAMRAKITRHVERWGW